MPGYSTLVMLVFVLFAIDGYILGFDWSTNGCASCYPDSTDTGFKLGWYALTRVT